MIEKVFVDPKDTIIAKSSAEFHFRNCPNELIKSEQIEIAHIGAKW